MKIYVRHRPRSIALADEDYALVIRYAENASTVTNSKEPPTPKCIIEFARRADIKLEEQYGLLSDIEHDGCLGLIEINSDIFVCLISSSEQVAFPRQGEVVNLIHAVEFYCVNRSVWDYIILDENGMIKEQNLGLAGTAIDYVPRTHIGTEHPCSSIRKLLMSKSFYYSSDFDLATVLQYR